jgi:hypothetical protein
VSSGSSPPPAATTTIAPHGRPAAPIGAATDDVNPSRRIVDPMTLLTGASDACARAASPVPRTRPIDDVGSMGSPDPTGKTAGSAPCRPTTDAVPFPS